MRALWDIQDNPITYIEFSLWKIRETEKFIFLLLTSKRYQVTEDRSFKKAQCCSSNTKKVNSSWKCFPGAFPTFQLSFLGVSRSTKNSKGSLKRPDRQSASQVPPNNLRFFASVKSSERKILPTVCILYSTCFQKWERTCSRLIFLKKKTKMFLWTRKIQFW